MAKDWTKIYKKYKSLWVGLAKDEMTVVGSGKTLKIAHGRAIKNGYKEAIYMYVPKVQGTFIGAL